MQIISDERAAEIVASLKAKIERIDPVTGGAIDPYDLLVIKLYEDVQALKKGTAFLGVGSGIPAVQRVEQS